MLVGLLGTSKTDKRGTRPGGEPLGDRKSPALFRACPRSRAKRDPFGSARLDVRRAEARVLRPARDVAGRIRRMRARALYRDLGRSGVAVAAVAAAVMVVASFAAVHSTRAVYMSLAAFHGWLEMAALAFFVARGRIGRASTSVGV